jgi:aryl-alcohol dehydrogenase-like predicted oxidoreductase
MDLLAGLPEDVRKLALDRFRIIQPHLEQNRPLQSVARDRYIEFGGNFINTANGYNKGRSEKIIGDHIGHDREKRDRLVIATKFSTNLYPGDPNGGGSNRKSGIAACEQSLRRLRTDYIDLYWLHNWDKDTPIEETMAALQDLVQSGKVRYIGVSDTPSGEDAAGSAPLTPACIFRSKT